MNIIESIRIAWTALLANKLRSLLTMLGMIIGVGAVIGMLAIGNGMQQFLNSQFSRLGIGTFYVLPFINTREVNVQQQARLTYDDAQALLAPGVAPAVKAVSVEFGGSGLVRANGKSNTYSVRAVTPSVFSITDNPLGAGRYYTEAEEQTGARVAVVGREVATTLFDTMALAIGQHLTINGVTFEVIGVIDPVGEGGPDGDPGRIIMIPYRTGRNWLFRNQMTPRVNTNTVIVQAKDTESVDEAIAQTTALLRQRHRLTYQDNDFTIIDVGQITGTINSIIGGFNAFLSLVAGISLLVGGIGIMNIMLVSVSERTREIGLRKAVGARRQDILMQFLIEALVLCLTGGFIGIVLGYLLSFLGTFVLVTLFQAEGAIASVTLSAIALATAISSAIGIFFGFWPALQASRLNPIEALRYE